MNEVTDSEVLQIMIDGGERLCDYALDKWIAGDYCGPRPWSDQEEKMRQAFILRWKKTRTRMRELGRKIKDAELA